MPDTPRMETAAALRVGIADDDVLLREGLASLLSRMGFSVVFQAGNADTLIALARQHRPDVVIVDIRMPPGHATEGIEAARVLGATLPDVAVLLLSAHVEVEEAMELLGGEQRIGYLLKSRVTDIDRFVDDVRRLVGGDSVIDPGLVEELFAARRRVDPLAQLTAREREVLALMAEGASNAGIARRLFVTEGTVEKHVHSILAKLDLPETPDDHRRVRAVIAFLDA